MRRVIAAMLLIAGIASVSAGQLSAEQAEQLRQAQRQIEDGDLREAIEALGSLADSNPTLAEAHRLLGHAYRRAGRPAAARAAFVRSIGHGRLTADTLAAIAQLDREAGRDLAAVTAMQWLTLLDPEESRYGLLQARLMLDAGQVQSAAAMAQALAERDPDSIVVHKLLGNIQLQQAGQTRAAAETLATAFWLGPEDGELARTVAELQFQLGHVGAAVAWYRRALDATAGQSKWRLRFAELLIAAERYEEAAGVLSALSDVEGVDGSAVYRWLGHVRQKLGDRAAALRAWRQAIDLGLRDRRIIGVLVGHALEQNQRANLEALLPLLAEGPSSSQPTVQLLVQGNLRIDRRQAALAAVRGYVETAGLDDFARRLLAVIQNRDNKAGPDA